MRLLLLLLLAAPVSAGDWAEGARAFAQAREALPPPGLAVLRAADGALLVSGPDCAVLGRQADALSGWKSRLGEAPGSAPSCRCAEGRCSLDVSSVAPEFVARVHGTRAGRWGPNCWNTALVSNGILSVPGYTSQEEMSFWMSSPLCRRLSAAEPPLPGDIAAIRDAGGAEVHAFVYLSEELAFSKNYMTAASPYALQSPSDVFAVYPVPLLCRASGGAPGCPAYIDLFRCSSREDYLRASGLSPEEAYLETERAVSEVERAVHALVFGWRRGPAFRDHADGVLDSSRTALRPLRRRTAEGSGLLWEALRLRIDALLFELQGI